MSTQAIGTMKPHRPDPHEEWVLAHATHFTTVVFRGRGRYETLEHPTLDAARAAAQERLSDTPRGVMIYAVTGIHQAHVETLNQNRRTQ
jgi:hypothetical protein